jgi:4-hydroxybenzoate polyprenyltransferase
MIKDVLKAVRPKQWSKNIIVFAGLVFAEDIVKIEKITLSLFAFAIFCMISSGGYLINDVIDRKKDALHPQKRFRPIAAGRIKPNLAIGLAVVLVLASLWFAFQLNFIFANLILFYFLMTLGYSLFLKNVMIVDVLVIATGFMIRAIGGTVIISEQLSSWLIICTTFLALFLAINKRKAEVVMLGDKATKTRKTLRKYNSNLLDQMINTVTSACLISYALYTLDTETVYKFGTRNLIFTLPFVIYGLFRYLYIVHHKKIGESPEIAIFSDIPIIICVLLYGLTIAVIIYF